MSYDSFDHDLERGMQNRRRMLGDQWVDRSVSNANCFNAEFQNLITRFAWHEIWGRPGLDAKMRRVIVLATTMALARWEEFELHTRAALLGDPETRLTPDELKEVLMQSAIYAGVPAANTGFTHAMKILREVGDQLGYPLAPASALDSTHPGVGKQAITQSKPGLHYTVRPPRHGKAPRHTVVLSHALGCDLMMWDALANRLAADCRIIAYDHRGHGGSDAPPGRYPLQDLADDAARLLRELDSGPVVWIGLSMGGMVGQELALRHPSLVNAMVIANSTSQYPPEARGVWQQRIDTVAGQGMEGIADAVMGRYFHDGYRTAQPAVVARYRQRLLTTDPVGYLGCCHAVAAMNTSDRLKNIAVPTLVIAGELDQGTPLAMAQALAGGIPHSRLVVLSHASHLSVIEQPEAFAAAVMEFLQTL